RNNYRELRPGAYGETAEITNQIIAVGCECGVQSIVGRNQYFVGRQSVGNPNETGIIGASIGNREDVGKVIAGQNWIGRGGGSGEKVRDLVDWIEYSKVESPTADHRTKVTLRIVVGVERPVAIRDGTVEDGKDRIVRPSRSWICKCWRRIVDAGFPCARRN